MRCTLATVRRFLAAAAALVLLAGFGGELWPMLDIAAAFRVHVALLAGGISVLCLAGRDWWAMGLAAAAAALAVATLGSARAPALHPGDGLPVTLLFGNVHDTNRQPAELAAALIEVRADILATAETPRAAAEALSAAYPYSLVSETPTETARTALWSRFPIRGGTLYLNNTVAPTGASAVIDLGGGAVLGLIVGHFSRPSEAELPAQIEALGPMAATLPRPLVVIGDFNAAPWSHAVGRAAEVTETRILGGYRITWRGWYRTPVGRILEPWGHQIDQALISDGIGVASAEALLLPGSDHRGLLLHLRVPRP